MDVVSELCNVVTVLDGGRVIAEGAVEKKSSAIPE